MRPIPHPAIERLAALNVADRPEERLHERHRLTGIEPQRATRLLASADGWIAVTLSRSSDWEMVPAWLEAEPLTEGDWDSVARHVEERKKEELIERATLVGIPAAAVGEITDPRFSRRHHLGETSARPLHDLTVVDLSALWAGPLCGALLAEHGARVVKVESIERPDGARATPEFFEHLNAMKEQRAVPVEELPAVVADADIVIEASRPRALANLGVDAFELVRSGRPRVWMSITAYGRESHRVGFGDDTAAAGGLVEWEGGRPWLLGDAAADPATGMVAARMVLDAVDRGGRWLLDVAMAGVAAWMAAP